MRRMIFAGCPLRFPGFVPIQNQAPRDAFFCCAAAISPILTAALQSRISYWFLTHGDGLLEAMVLK